MAKYEAKMVPTRISVDAFIDGVENEQRKADARTVCELMEKMSGKKPVMWGPSIIGFGTYHFKYESGHEGDAPEIGFSPRKSSLVFYLYNGYDDYSQQLKKLGKHKTSKACLYIDKLTDIDMSVLKEMIQDSLNYMRKK